jgi:hypothetical protein
MANIHTVLYWFCHSDLVNHFAVFFNLQLWYGPSNISQVSFTGAVLGQKYLLQIQQKINQFIITTQNKKHNE